MPIIYLGIIQISYSVTNKKLGGQTVIEVAEGSPKLVESR